MSDSEDHDRRVRAQYDRWAPWYDHLWASYTQRSLDPFAAWIDPKPRERVLEVGSGTGELTQRLLDRASDLSVCGVDLSPGMIRRARAKFPDEERVRFVQASATELPFEEGAFDRVVSANSFHYFAEPEAALAEVRRVLRPNGAFDLLDWSADFGTVRLLDRVLGAVDPAHHRIYRLAEAENLLEEASLRIERTASFRSGLVWGFLMLEAARG